MTSPEKKPPSPLPPAIGAESLVPIMGVVYVHHRTSDGGDLYLTQFGLPFATHLELENWAEKKWFEKHRERLAGTSCVYRVPTRRIHGTQLDLVVKNCRVGEDVPLNTHTLMEFMNAEFNSPWEEFALVMEMREGKFGRPSLRINTQMPLAIYIPPDRMQTWQSGRSRAKINHIKRRHPGIELDILRQYRMIYGWIHGDNVVDMLRESGLAGDDLVAELQAITTSVVENMSEKGYVVADMKPSHIILPATATDRRRIDDEKGGGDIPAHIRAVKQRVDSGDYSVVDYELLFRTPQHEEEVLRARRHSYLDDQRDRYTATELPPHLKHATVLTVPYIFGHVESTGGLLWVVGRNGRLFDYFLPERWRTHHPWKLSDNNEVVYTYTKDHIHIVWKTSRVGEKPSPEDIAPSTGKIREYGFNSPFEEAAIARDLNEKGVGTVYMRAIYMTGTRKSEKSEDSRVYRRHSSLCDPEGNPLLRKDHNYITIRGYYNGPDSWVASHSGALCRPIDLVQALCTGLIQKQEYKHTYTAVIDALHHVHYDGSLLAGNDILLVRNPTGELRRETDGTPEWRICNFELIKRTEEGRGRR